MADEDEGQLWKFNLPSSERGKVLAHLSEQISTRTRSSGPRKAFWRRWPIAN